MRKVAVYILALASLPVAGLACDAGPAEEVAFPSADHALGTADRGSLVKLNKGQTLKIGLDAAPPQGFNWRPSALDKNILRQVGTQYTTKKTNWVLFQRSVGVQTLLFEAVDSGQTALTLVYERQGEEGYEFADAFSVRIVVR